MDTRTMLAGVVIIGLLGAGCAPLGGRPEASTARTLGWRSDLGNGTVSSYAELDNSGTPSAIGIVLSATALEGLPSGSDGHHCFDRNKDGVIDPATECNETFEFVIPLPDVVSRRSDIPFKWVMFNWNPHGHVPPGIWDIPHFDVHFYIEPKITNILAIRSGACGPEFVDCHHWEVGRRPLAPNHIHPDFQMAAVVPAMGGHLFDRTDPVFKKQPFTRSWLFGAYDGNVIFYENMVTRAFLLSQPDVCDPIKSPKALRSAGSTRQCPAFGETRRRVNTPCRSKGSSFARRAPRSPSHQNSQSHGARAALRAGSLGLARPLVGDRAGPACQRTRLHGTRRAFRGRDEIRPAPGG